MTFDDGRMSTWRLPRFSALETVFKQSASTLMRTIWRGSGGVRKGTRL